MNRVERVRVKICGLTRAEDAALAVDLGADALGFICWRESPRYVEPRSIREIAAAVPPFVTLVGVFVDAAPDEVAGVVRAAGLGAVQLHGEERVADYRDVGARLLKRTAIDDDEALAEAVALPRDVLALVDAVDPTARGGTGRRADWTRAARLARARPLVLAGGLTADNVAEAVRVVRPWAVDVSSGVERAAGVKSPERLRAFIDAVAGVRSEDA
ncbi:MAG: phosphoribosylanthranilate isomerase [Acidobacteria bacterium]|nr:phosphoribosylanthranilate isomerase [Acidobacteriota bacterium]